MYVVRDVMVSFLIVFCNDRFVKCKIMYVCYFIFLVLCGFLLFIN